MTKMKYILFTLVLALGLLFIPYTSYGETQVLKSAKLIIFYSSGCRNCIRIEREITRADRMELFKNNIETEYRNVDDIENYKFLLGLEEKYKSKIRNVLPVFYFQGHFVNGKGDVKKNLKILLSTPVSAVDSSLKTLPKIDLVKHFNSFTIPAIIAVGLIDGINPCAVTVIVFFMSFLAFQGYRKREMAVIGLVFILSVYLTYCLIGLGIFEFLYRLRGFWILTKIINISIGVVSIIFSFYALYDFIQYRKTRSTSGMLLSLPQWIRNLTYRIIGSQYRGRKHNPLFKKSLIGLTVSALISGFLVSILEAVCVAKIYLPTIIFVLKTTGLKLRALTYLLLYNLLFVVPLLVILCLVLTGTTVDQFHKVLMKHLGIVKISMAVTFLGLGIFLIWRA